MRLEAGRHTRHEMEKHVETRSEGTIARALEMTFKPMQKLLRGDEVELDKLVSHGAVHMEEDAYADAAARKIEKEMHERLVGETDRIIKDRQTQIRHQSKEYIKKVHLKAKAALNNVVNPDTLTAVAASTIAPPAASSGEGDGWSSKMSSFLSDTEKYMAEQEDEPAAAPAPVAHHSLPAHAAAQPRSVLIVGGEANPGKPTENTAIDATKEELEQHLRSEEAKRKAGPHPTEAKKSAAAARVGAKAKTHAKASIKMNEKQEKAFQRALDSYL